MDSASLVDGYLSASFSRCRVLIGFIHFRYGIRAHATRVEIEPLAMQNIPRSVRYTVLFEYALLHCRVCNLRIMHLRVVQCVCNCLPLCDCNVHIFASVFWRPPEDGKANNVTLSAGAINAGLLRFEATGHSCHGEYSLFERHSDRPSAKTGKELRSVAIVCDGIPLNVTLSSFPALTCIPHKLHSSM